MRKLAILGFGEIGQTIGRICEEAGFQVLIKELSYDQTKGERVDYLHVCIPEKEQQKFVKVVSSVVKELKPRLTVIHSSVTPGTTDKVHQETKAEIVHSPVIGIHPNLYESVRFVFPKIIGPTTPESLKLAKQHLRALGFKLEIYNSAKTSEAAKLLDLVYYAWNIVFVKEMKKICDELKLDIHQVYIRHNQIYNGGYERYLPNVVRPILVPVDGPITGHCTIPDAVLFEKHLPNFLTKTVIRRNNLYKSEVGDPDKKREEFIKNRNRYLVKSKENG